MPGATRITKMSSQKIISALHANWWLNLVGLLISFCTSVVLVRTMPVELYAQYAAVLAMISLATLIFEAGANSGLTRYLTEASQQNARGTFYRCMQRRRWLAAALCAAVLIAFGPIYARHTQFKNLTTQPWLFVLIAAVVATTLTRLLAHYGLLALFESKAALLFQQGFQITRSGTLALIALAGGRLMHLVLGLLAIACLEALLVHRQLWRIIRTERAPVSRAFVNRAQTFGLLTVFDKACAMLGSGTVLLLVLAPKQSAATMALLGLAVDLVGKIVSLTVMPMGNLVAPYLSYKTDDADAQALAAGRVVKLSSLLYSFSIGAGVIFLPQFVSTLYGQRYHGAAALALLLLVPTAFENWIRGTCSPTLLRNGRNRELIRVNIIQAIVTLSTLVLVMRLPIEIAVLAVGIARAATASLNLLAMRRIVGTETYRVPLQGIAIGALACASALCLGRFFPMPAVTSMIVQGLVFGVIFYAGLRWLVFRDEDTLHLAHRIAGGRIKPFNRLLPPPPLTGL
jgi:O-antigen/teichoic acid export membrane protein